MISVAKEISSQREFKSNTWMPQILLVERKQKLPNQEYDVVYLLIPLSSKMDVLGDDRLLYLFF